MSENTDMSVFLRIAKWPPGSFLTVFVDFKVDQH